MGSSHSDLKDFPEGARRGAGPNLDFVQRGFEPFNLRTEESAQDHVVLGSPAYQWVIVQTPASIASIMHVADPPVRRGETPIKRSL
jgi:hypothetical protein